MYHNTRTPPAPLSYTALKTTIYIQSQQQHDLRNRGTNFLDEYLYILFVLEQDLRE